MRLVISTGRGWLNCLAWNFWAQPPGRDPRSACGSAPVVSSCPGCRSCGADGADFFEIGHGPFAVERRGFGQAAVPAAAVLPTAGWTRSFPFEADRLTTKHPRARLQNDRREYNDSCHDWIPEENRAMEDSFSRSPHLYPNEPVFQRASIQQARWSRSSSFSKQRPQAELGYEEIRRYNEQG